MNYLVIGFLGFIVIHLSDLLFVRRIRFAKPSVWIAGAVLIGYAAAMAFLWPEKLPLPSWTTWLGWALLLTSLPVLLYSLFISLPFVETYVSADAKEQLITTGFYALARHPWVHWHVLVALSLFLASKSELMLYGALSFIGLDILAITIQDKFFFLRMFPGYEEYRRQTPMLIPNRKSFKAFFTSLRSSKGRSLSNRTKETADVHLS